MILTCGHACCASCLLRYHDACTKSDDENTEDADRTKFSCVLCRKELALDLMQDVARLVTSNRLVDSLNQLHKLLPFSQEEFDDLAVSLLLGKFAFDMNKVESAIFNMVGLLGRNENENLNAEQKQELYELARKPVLKLQEEFLSMRQTVYSINDTDSNEWKEMKKELDELQKKLNEARQNAASDIFERINSRGNMGVLEETGIVHVDLHCLHVNEAKERVKEFVLPILPVLKRMIIITGHGAHSGGSSVLKESLKSFFNEIGVRCEETKNKGTLCLCV